MLPADKRPEADDRQFRNYRPSFCLIGPLPFFAPLSNFQMKNTIASLGHRHPPATDRLRSEPQGLVLNHNENATQVQLGEANFRNVGKVMGTDSVRYVLVFGGMKKKQLYAHAYANMLDKAAASGSACRGERDHGGACGGVFPFSYKRTVTVSGQVIEFTR